VANATTEEYRQKLEVMQLDCTLPQSNAERHSKCRQLIILAKKIAHVTKPHKKKKPTTGEYGGPLTRATQYADVQSTIQAADTEAHRGARATKYADVRSSGTTFLVL
jgi:hypothetical protein